MLSVKCLWSAQFMFGCNSCIWLPLVWLSFTISLVFSFWFFHSFYSLCFPFRIPTHIKEIQKINNESKKNILIFFFFICLTHSSNVFIGGSFNMQTEKFVLLFCLCRRHIVYGICKGLLRNAKVHSPINTYC